MSKKRNRRGCGSGLPPEGLWISPEGDYLEVVEHLLALYERPDLFDLSESEVAPPDTARLRDVAVRLIAEGWTRFRYLSGVWCFEVDKAKRRIDLIESILTRYGALKDDPVTVSQLQPIREFCATPEEIYDRTIFGYQENPQRNTWRFSS